MHELFKKYRPKTLDEVVGQPEAVSVLRGWLKAGKVPHSVLFSGPSGCGKTTLARILASELQCGKLDYYEVNAAEARGLDDVRSINERMGAAPASGKCRVWVLDEAHQLTRKKGGDAQTALLKMLEDTPRHVYFMLCTTDPGDLLLTVRNRCAHVKLGTVGDGDMHKVVCDVLMAEHKDVPRDVVDRIVEAAEGSPRRALVLLETVLGLKDEEEQLAAIEKPTARREAFDIVKVLLYKGKPNWNDVLPVVRDLSEEAESLRLLILACAGTEMLKGKNCGRAALIITAFEGYPFHAGKSGKASLLRACYEVCMGAK